MKRQVGIAVLLLLMVGCRTPGRPIPESGTGVHVVVPGETAWSISKHYGTTVDDLKKRNRLRDATSLMVGQRLIVPTHLHEPQPRLKNVWDSTDPRGSATKAKFRWPIDGKITSGYGLRNGAHHDGVDISAGTGTPIRAAEAGRVIHSGSGLSGYGNMVIVKHTGNLSSVYAHNRKNHVKVGDFVEQGQRIAEVGQTGRATAPHLHFEVRRDGHAVNPLDYLR